MRFYFSIFILCLCLCSCTDRSSQQDTNTQDPEPPVECLRFWGVRMSHDDFKTYWRAMHHHYFLRHSPDHRLPLYEGTYKGAKTFIRISRKPVAYGDSIWVKDRVAVYVTGSSREQLIPIFKEINCLLKI